jgi:HlyD family secretion protein
VNAAISEFVGAQSAYNESKNSLTLEQAGSAPETIQTQQAKTAAAQAAVDTVQSQINHTIIRAPFDGVVTDVAHKIGEVVSAGTPTFTMITPTLKVETQVPENAIAKINVGDKATITLDAYGSGTTFNAQVSQVDPAETVANGINTYKVTLEFLTPDTRVRSGMTANASIVTAEADSALAIPTQAIITHGTSTFVLIHGADGQFVNTPVQTGITGSNGYTTITSGLTGDENIASFGSNQ